MATAPAKPSAALQQRVIEIAEAMNHQPWQSKLLEAMDFVLRGDVDLINKTVKSGEHQYQFDDEYGCTCVDAKVRKRTCKHAVAVEMQKRLEGIEMPRKTNQQEEWEAQVQKGEQVNELFGNDEPAELDDAVVGSQAEEEDIPEPEVPENVRRAAKEMAQVATDLVEKTVHTQGHQYTDYPSTLSIKRQVGATDLMWTFRGTLDEEVWGRAGRMIRTIDDLAKRYAPPAPPAPPQQLPQQPTPPAQQAEPPAPQATYVTTAAGQVPMCPAHQRPMKPSQYGGFYCTSRSPDGTYCKTKV